MKTMRKILSMILTLSLVLTLGVQVFASNGSVDTLDASASKSAVRVSGTTSGVNVAVSVQVYQGDGNSPTIIGMDSFTVNKNGEFEGVVALTKAYDESAPINVRAADFEGGSWKKVEGLIVNDDAAELQGFKLRIGDTIGVDYYVELESELLDPSADTTVCFEYDTSVVKLRKQDVKLDTSKSEDVNGKTYYIFTCEVNISDMTMPINATVKYDGDREIYFAPFQVRDYAMYVLQTSTDETTRNFVEALLSYGYYAQIKFNPTSTRYAEDKLDLPDSQTIMNSTMADVSRSAIQCTDGASYYGSSVVFLAGNRIRHYFTITGDVTITVDGQTRTKYTSGNLFYVTSDILNVMELDRKVEVTVSNGQETQVSSYSVMNYVYAILQSDTSTKEMKDLVKALYMYYSAARDYVDAHS